MGLTFSEGKYVLSIPLQRDPVVAVHFIVNLLVGLSTF